MPNYGKPVRQDADAETHPTMKSNHETDWLFSAHPLPNSSSRARPEGINKRNLANADLNLIETRSGGGKGKCSSSGYEVNLFAQEPMLANPVHMTWDNRGRLGSHAHGHPQLKPGEVANDKIIVLEDTDETGGPTSQPSLPTACTCPESNWPMEDASSARARRFF